MVITLIIYIINIRTNIVRTEQAKIKLGVFFNQRSKVQVIPHTNILLNKYDYSVRKSKPYACSDISDILTGAKY